MAYETENKIIKTFDGIVTAEEAGNVSIAGVFHSIYVDDQVVAIHVEITGNDLNDKSNAFYYRGFGVGTRDEGSAYASLATEVFAVPNSGPITGFVFNGIPYQNDDIDLQAVFNAAGSYRVRMRAEITFLVENP